MGELEEIARQTPGRTGTDLASIVNQAAVVALKDEPAKRGGTITHDDPQQAQSMLRITA